MDEQQILPEQYKSPLTNEVLDQLPLTQFEGRLVVVDTPEAIDKAVFEIRKHTMLGFDTETRPSFKRGVAYKVALLQLSSENVSWLFRINKIGLPNEVVRILEDPNILKAGVAIRDDIKGLQKWHPFTPGNFVDLQNVAKEIGIQDFSLKKLAAHAVGVRISKRQRLTNWEADSLTIQQQVYAATDSWISLLSYEGFANGVVVHPNLRAALRSSGVLSYTPGQHDDNNN